MKLYIRATDMPDFQSMYNFGSFHKKLANENYFWSGYKQPIKSSLCKRLNAKPINQLTLEDIVVLFTMEDTRFMEEFYRYDGDFLKWLSKSWDAHEQDLRSCYEWVHSLKFPLKIYRAVTDEQELAQDISGKSRAWSWTTDPNLYTASNSIFKNVAHIYSAEIDYKVISNINTIRAYVFYSANPSYGRYPEYEIALKNRFKMSDLHNLTKVK